MDHLISLELGGSNSIRNLWPESRRTQPWNAWVKDALENKLHRMVCTGQLDLKVAQHDIATNWIAAYKKYFHTDLPVSKSPSAGSTRGPHANPPAGQPAPAGQPGQVWVNTKSGVYWKQGTRYYGKTKEGRYMSEEEAIRQGYHAAGSR